MNTGYRDHDLVVSLVTDILATPADIVITTKFHDIRHEIVTLNDEILHNHVGHRIGHLDARHRDIANVLKDRRQNNVSDIFEQVLLESDIATSVSTQVIEELLQS